LHRARRPKDERSNPGFRATCRDRYHERRIKPQTSKSSDFLVAFWLSALKPHDRFKRDEKIPVMARTRMSTYPSTTRSICSGHRVHGTYRACRCPGRARSRPNLQTAAPETGHPRPPPPHPPRARHGHRQARRRSSCRCAGGYNHQVHGVDGSCRRRRAWATRSCTITNTWVWREQAKAHVRSHAR
jgi:hypothetical protein